MVKSVELLYDNSLGEAGKFSSWTLRNPLSKWIQSEAIIPMSIRILLLLLPRVMRTSASRSMLPQIHSGKSKLLGQKLLGSKDIPYSITRKEYLWLQKPFHLKHGGTFLIRQGSLNSLYNNCAVTTGVCSWMKIKTVVPIH